MNEWEDYLTSSFNNVSLCEVADPIHHTPGSCQVSEDNYVINVGTHALVICNIETISPSSTNSAFPAPISPYAFATSTLPSKSYRTIYLTSNDLSFTPYATLPPTVVNDGDEHPTAEQVTMRDHKDIHLHSLQQLINPYMYHTDFFFRQLFPGLNHQKKHGHNAETDPYDKTVLLQELQDRSIAPSTHDLLIPSGYQHMYHYHWFYSRARPNDVAVHPTFVAAAWSQRGHYACRASSCIFSVISLVNDVTTLSLHAVGDHFPDSSRSRAPLIANLRIGWNSMIHHRYRRLCELLMVYDHRNTGGMTAATPLPPASNNTDDFTHDRLKVILPQVPSLLHRMAASVSQAWSPVITVSYSITWYRSMSIGKDIMITGTIPVSFLIVGDALGLMHIWVVPALFHEGAQCTMSIGILNAESCDGTNGQTNASLYHYQEDLALRGRVVSEMAADLGIVLTHTNVDAIPFAYALRTRQAREQDRLGHRVPHLPNQSPLSSLALVSDAEYTRCQRQLLEDPLYLCRESTSPSGADGNDSTGGSHHNSINQANNSVTVETTPPYPHGNNKRSSCRPLTLPSFVSPDISALAPFPCYFGSILADKSRGSRMSSPVSPLSSPPLSTSSSTLRSADTAAHSEGWDYTSTFDPVSHLVECDLTEPSMLEFPLNARPKTTSISICPVVQSQDPRVESLYSHSFYTSSPTLLVAVGLSTGDIRVLTLTSTHIHVDVQQTREIQYQLPIAIDSQPAATDMMMVDRLHRAQTDDGRCPSSLLTEVAPTPALHGVFQYSVAASRSPHQSHRPAEGMDDTVSSENTEDDPRQSIGRGGATPSSMDSLAVRDLTWAYYASHRDNVLMIGGTLSRNTTTMSMHQQQQPLPSMIPTNIRFLVCYSSQSDLHIIEGIPFLTRCHEPQERSKSGAERLDQELTIHKTLQYKWRAMPPTRTRHVDAILSINIIFSRYSHAPISCDIWTAAVNTLVTGRATSKDKDAAGMESSASTSIQHTSPIGVIAVTGCDGGSTLLPLHLSPTPTPSPDTTVLSPSNIEHLTSTHNHNQFPDCLVLENPIYQSSSQDELQRELLDLAASPQSASHHSQSSPSSSMSDHSKTPQTTTTLRFSLQTQSEVRRRAMQSHPLFLATSWDRLALVTMRYIAKHIEEPFHVDSLAVTSTGSEQQTLQLVDVDITDVTASEKSEITSTALEPPTQRPGSVKASIVHDKLVIAQKNTEVVVKLSGIPSIGPDAAQDASEHNNATTSHPQSEEDANTDVDNPVVTFHDKVQITQYEGQVAQDLVDSIITDKYQHHMISRVDSLLHTQIGALLHQGPCHLTEVPDTGNDAHLQRSEALHSARRQYTPDSIASLLSMDLRHMFFQYQDDIKLVFEFMMSSPYVYSSYQHYTRNRLQSSAIEAFHVVIDRHQAYIRPDRGQKRYGPTEMMTLRQERQQQQVEETPIHFCLTSSRDQNQATAPYVAETVTHQPQLYTTFTLQEIRRFHLHYPLLHRIIGFIFASRLCQYTLYLSTVADYERHANKPSVHDDSRDVDDDLATNDSNEPQIPSAALTTTPPPRWWFDIPYEPDTPLCWIDLDLVRTTTQQASSADNGEGKGSDTITGQHTLAEDMGTILVTTHEGASFLSVNKCVALVFNLALIDCDLVSAVFSEKSLAAHGPQHGDVTVRTGEPRSAASTLLDLSQYSTKLATLLPKIVEYSGLLSPPIGPSTASDDASGRDDHNNDNDASMADHDNSPRSPSSSSFASNLHHLTTTLQHVNTVRHELSFIRALLTFAHSLFHYAFFTSTKRQVALVNRRRRSRIGDRASTHDREVLNTPGPSESVIGWLQSFYSLIHPEYHVPSSIRANEEHWPQMQQQGGSDGQPSPPLLSIYQYVLPNIANHEWLYAPDTTTSPHQPPSLSSAVHTLTPGPVATMTSTITVAHSTLQTAIQLRLKQLTAVISKALDACKLTLLLVALPYRVNEILAPIISTTKEKVHVTEELHCLTYSVFKTIESVLKAPLTCPTEHSSRLYDAQKPAGLSEMITSTDGRNDTSTSPLSTLDTAALLSSWCDTLIRGDTDVDMDDNTMGEGPRISLEEQSQPSSHQHRASHSPDQHVAIIAQQLFPIIAHLDFLTSNTPAVLFMLQVSLHQVKVSLPQLTGSYHQQMGAERQDYFTQFGTAVLDQFAFTTSAHRGPNPTHGGGSSADGGNDGNGNTSNASSSINPLLRLKLSSVLVDPLLSLFQSILLSRLVYLVPYSYLLLGGCLRAHLRYASKRTPHHAPVHPSTIPTMTGIALKTTQDHFSLINDIHFSKEISFNLKTLVFVTHFMSPPSGSIWDKYAASRIRPLTLQIHPDLISFDHLRRLLMPGLQALRHQIPLLSLVREITAPNLNISDFVMVIRSSQVLSSIKHPRGDDPIQDWILHIPTNLERGTDVTFELCGDQAQDSVVYRSQLGRMPRDSHTSLVAVPFPAIDLADISQASVRPRLILFPFVSMIQDCPLCRHPFHVKAMSRYNAVLSQYFAKYLETFPVSNPWAAMIWQSSCCWRCSTQGI